MTPVNSERAGSDVSEIVERLLSLVCDEGGAIVCHEAACTLQRQARRIAALEGALQEIVDADERWVQHASAALEETP